MPRDATKSIDAAHRFILLTDIAGYSRLAEFSTQS
jgi:hypothetical protein